jgi:hypothetical protein
VTWRSFCVCSKDKRESINTRRGSDIGGSRVRNTTTIKEFERLNKNRQKRFQRKAKLEGRKRLAFPTRFASLEVMSQYSLHQDSAVQ